MATFSYLVMGSFLEGSEVGHLGLLPAESKGLANCREGSVQERAIILSGIRRQLSLVAARAYSACHLHRLVKVEKRWAEVRP